MPTEWHQFMSLSGEESKKKHTYTVQRKKICQFSGRSYSINAIDIWHWCVIIQYKNSLIYCFSIVPLENTWKENVSKLMVVGVIWTKFFLQIKAWISTAGCVIFFPSRGPDPDSVNLVIHMYGSWSISTRIRSPGFNGVFWTRGSSIFQWFQLGLNRIIGDRIIAVILLGVSLIIIKHFPQEEPVKAISNATVHRFVRLSPIIRGWKRTEINIQSTKVFFLLQEKSKMNFILFLII